MSAEPRIRVAVVFGGRSSEHAVSCMTAASVFEALDPARYEVVPIGIARDGRWVLESSDPAHLSLGADHALPSVDASRLPVQLAEGRLVPLAEASDPADVPAALGEVDVVLPLLHGPFGEDGTLQGLLEMAGVRYVGAGVLASAVAMDKHYMKVLLRSAGLPVLPHVLITPAGWERDREACRESVRALGMPVFVKPCRAGSSIGITKVHDLGELDAAVETAREHDPRVLVEAFAGPDARELECGVLDTPGEAASPEVSVVAEIKVGGSREFYDFEAKYLPDEPTVLVVPAEIDDQVSQRIRELAARAFELLGCEGLARVDFFVQHDGEVVINELNTMPGFTPTSMFPRVWQASGLEYPDLVDRLLRLALERPLGLR